MKKDVQKKGPCVHADEYGACDKRGFKYKGLRCAAAKCGDFEERTEAGENAGHSKPDAQLSTGEEKSGPGGAALPVASRACASAREGEELQEVGADEVVRAYVDAVNGVLSVIRFGAMMMVKETVLACENGYKKTDAGYVGGLRTWLVGMAPDVNYKTAMRMKGSAEAVAAGLGVPAGLLLRALGPDPKALEEEEIAVRERLIEIVHGRSERSLVLWLKGGARASPDGKDAEDAGKADELALDAARKFGRFAADALKCLDRRQQTALRTVLAKELRRELGPKGLVWLAAVIEEAEG